MKKAMIMITAVLAFATTGFADEASKAKLAEQLLVSMDVEKQMAQSFEMVKQSFPTMLAQMGVSGSDVAEQQEFMNKVMDMVAKEMSWANLKGDFIRIYADTFSEEELQGLVDFYQTPLGKKMIAKQPELAQKSMQISQGKMMKLIPKIQEMATQQ